MSVREFQRQYHDYAVDSREEATAELMRIGSGAVQDENGNVVPIVVAGFQGRYCLMLRKAYDYLQQLGVFVT